MKRRLNGRALLLSSTMLIGATGCHPRPYPGTAPRLPDKVPERPAIVFSGTSEEWPPRPRGRTSETDVPTTVREGALTEALGLHLRLLALQDARVRSALGERSAFVAAAELEPDKDRPLVPPGALPIRLTFYSYSNNFAVEVLMSGRGVESVRRREGYQPPEGAEEIEAAIALARRDERLPSAVHGLDATAIVTERQPGQPGYGHRVLHVSFSVPAADAPRYYALADLTDGNVITAGPVAAYEGGTR